MVVPESLKYFLIHVNNSLKTWALRIMNMNSKIDLIIAWIYRHMSMTTLKSTYFLYPRIYDVTDIGQPDCSYGYTLEES